MFAIEHNLALIHLDLSLEMQHLKTKKRFNIIMESFDEDLNEVATCHLFMYLLLCIEI